MAENARCVACELLGKPGSGESGLLELNEDHRESVRWSIFPICAALEVRFRKECQEANPEIPQDAVHGKVNQTRTCEEFVEWEPGFNPKEHKEMRMQQRFLEAQKDQRERDREWEAKQEREQRDWQEIRDTENRREVRHNMWISIGVGVLIGAFGTIVGWIRDSWKEDPKPPVVNNVIQLPDAKFAPAPKAP